MKINYNIPALRTLNQLNKVNDKSATTMERLSSGLRINRSADDAAGLAIANKMDAQIKGLQQANRNAMDGVSLVQTGEGALNEVHAMLQRMRELSVQAANGTYSEGDLKTIQQEINQLTEEINRIAETTEFNTKPLLKGDGSKTDLFLKDIMFNKGVEGTDATNEIKATAQMQIPTDMTVAELKNLEGKYITILPDGIKVSFTDIVSSMKEDESPSEALGRFIAESLTEQGFESSYSKGVIDIRANRPGVDEAIKIVDGDGNNENSVTLQIGANQDQTLGFTIEDMRTDALGLTGMPGEEGYTNDAHIGGKKGMPARRAALSVLTQEAAGNTINKLDSIIEKVSSQRSALGAVQNRLEYTTSNLGTSEENMTASLSRIQDADMAYEMAQYTQQNVLSQAATAMLAQANQRPQQVMQLLQR